MLILNREAEHTVDLETEVILSATVKEGTALDPQTLLPAVVDSQINLVLAGSDADIVEVAADKGYHSNTQITDCTAAGLRTYIPGPALPTTAAGVTSPRTWPGPFWIIATAADAQKANRCNATAASRWSGASPTCATAAVLAGRGFADWRKSTSVTRWRQRQTPGAGVPDAASVGSPHHHSKSHPPDTKADYTTETSFFNGLLTSNQQRLVDSNTATGGLSEP